MKKVFLFLLIALGVVVNAIAFDLKSRIVISEDKGKIYYINYNKEKDDTVTYIVKMMARPFINGSNIYALFESKDGTLKVPDSVIVGWSRIYQSDIILERQLVLLENQIFLQYDPDFKKVSSPYVFLGIFLGFVEILLVFVVFFGRKKYSSFTGILGDIFIGLFVSLMGLWLLNYFKVVHLNIGGPTLYDSLFLPIVTILPASLVNFINNRIKKRSQSRINHKAKNSSVALDDWHGDYL